MQITVNGETRQVPYGMMLIELLRELDVVLDRVAVELNRNIVRRTELDTTRLSEGDKLEIVTFVGGG